MTSGALSIFTPRAATLVLRSVSDPSRETTARRGDRLEIISQLGRGFAEVEYLGQRWFAAESGLEPWSAGAGAAPPPPQGYAANPLQAYPQSAPPPSPGPPPGGGWQGGYASRQQLPQVPVPSLIAALCGVVVIVGSFGSWATGTDLIGFRESVSGMDFNSDFKGQMTLVLGLIALVSVALAVVLPLYQQWLVGLALAVLLGAAAIGIYHIVDIGRVMAEIGSKTDSNPTDYLNVGWGLIAVTAGAVAGSVLCIVQLIRISARRPMPVMRW